MNRAHDVQTRERIGQRTRETLAQKRARGECVGEAPFGYRVSDDGRSLEPDPEEHAVLRLVLDWYDEGYSQRAIADALNRGGYPNRDRVRGRWRHNQIGRMVRRAHCA